MINIELFINYLSIISVEILSCFVHLIKSVKKRNKIAIMCQECAQKSFDKLLT